MTDTPALVAALALVPTSARAVIEEALAERHAKVSTFAEAMAQIGALAERVAEMQVLVDSRDARAGRLAPWQQRQHRLARRDNALRAAAALAGGASARARSAALAAALERRTRARRLDMAAATVLDLALDQVLSANDGEALSAATVRRIVFGT